MGGSNEEGQTMRLSKLFVVVIAICIAGCDSGGDSNQGSSFTGNYLLISVEGQPLPAIIVQVLNDTVEITAGNIRINADQTFSSSATARLTESGGVTTETVSQTGTYTNNNTAFTFTYSDGTSETGSISGNDLTLISEGLALVFRK